MSECHSSRHLNEFTETGAQPLEHNIRGISVSKSVESFLFTYPAFVKHSIKSPQVMYRTRSPLKGKQDTSYSGMEGSLDQALQAIREQLATLANERRNMEMRADTLATGVRAAHVQSAASRSVVTVQRKAGTAFRAPFKTPVKEVEEVDYYAAKEANQDRASVSSAGSSHESLLAQNSPDVMRAGNASLKHASSEAVLKTQGTPSHSPHVTVSTAEAPRHGPATAGLQTPSRSNSILSDSTFSLPYVSQLSMDKPEDDEDRAKWYSSSLAIGESNPSSPAFPSETRLTQSDSKRSGGSTTIVRRSSETGQLEHYRKPNRYMSFSNTTKVAQVQSRHNNSPLHEKPKHLKNSRTSVILPGIETTV